jgi:lipopolysaccharide export system permease protein
MVADTGRLTTSADKRYLMLHLIQGESFENIDQKQQRATGTKQNIPYRRETFASKSIIIDFSTEFTRYDESILEDQHVSKNMTQLLQSIDSTHNVAQARSREQSSKLIKERYFGRENGKEQVIPTQLTPEQITTHDLDSLWMSLDVHKHRQALSLAHERALNYRDQIEYNAIMLNDSQRYIRKHEIELYRKFTLAFACLIFFFIGAPLGAIIRKGGLGAPVVISVIMFIIYYIIDNTGYKMAREALWPSWAGMWLSSFILLPIGIFLTYKAAKDSPLFNPEAWGREWQKIKQVAMKIYDGLIFKIIKNKKTRYKYED